MSLWVDWFEIDQIIYHPFKLHNINKKLIQYE